MAGIICSEMLPFRNLGIMIWCPLKYGWSHLILQVLFWNPVLMTVDLAFACSQEFPSSDTLLSWNQAFWKPQHSQNFHISSSLWCPRPWRSQLRVSYSRLECFRSSEATLMSIHLDGFFSQYLLAIAPANIGVSQRTLGLSRATQGEAGDIPKMTSSPIYLN